VATRWQISGWQRREFEKTLCSIVSEKGDQNLLLNFSLDCQSSIKIFVNKYLACFSKTSFSIKIRRAFYFIYDLLLEAFAMHLTKISRKWAININK
jgi:hypothetical protein